MVTPYSLGQYRAVGCRANVGKAWLTCNSVLMCDYYLIRRSKGYDIKQLYLSSGIYWYRSGINYRAMVAFFLGMVPQLPGLAYQINPEIKDISWNYLGFASLGWLDGVVFSA